MQSRRFISLSILAIIAIGSGGAVRVYVPDADGRAVCHGHAHPVAGTRGEADARHHDEHAGHRTAGFLKTDFNSKYNMDLQWTSVGSGQALTGRGSATSTC